MRIPYLRNKKVGQASRLSPSFQRRYRRWLAQADFASAHLFLCVKNPCAGNRTPRKPATLENQGQAGRLSYSEPLTVDAPDGAHCGGANVAIFVSVAGDIGQHGGQAAVVS